MSRGLHSLTVKNFGILGEIEVDLGRLNVLVGPNGSGKSTLLRVIQFLGDAARGDLAAAVRDHGGIERVRTRRPRGKSGSIVIKVKAEVTSRSHAGALDEYTLTFRPFLVEVQQEDGTSKRGVVHEESFKFKRTANQGRRITLKSGTLLVFDEGVGAKREQRRLNLNKEAFGLALLPQLGPDQGGAEVRKIQELFTTFRVFDINTAAARTPSDVRDPVPLRSDASNLAAFLRYLHDTHSATFEDLRRDAREVIPGFVDLQFRAVGGATEAVTVDVVDRAIPGTTPLADASFGTVRALALLAMLYDPSPPLVTCVEEIDHGLHPHVFDRLVALLRIASTRTQFLIATHSPALVNRLNPAELIVCERDAKSGLANIPAVDPEEIARVHEDSGYGLGELWFSGTLGGVPR